MGEETGKWVDDNEKRGGTGEGGVRLLDSLVVAPKADPAPAARAYGTKVAEFPSASICACRMGVRVLQPALTAADGAGIE